MPKEFLANLQNIIVKNNQSLIAELQKNNNSDIIKTLQEENGKLAGLFQELKQAISDNKVDRVEIANFPKPVQIPKTVIPEFPKEIEIKKPSWYEKFVPDKILEYIKAGFEFSKKSFESALDRHKEPENALAVRLVNKEGKEFYTAMFTAMMGGINAAGLATETTLAALLAELQLKADLTETQPVSGTLNQGTPAAAANAWPTRIINTDNTDNSYTSGGVYGQKVHVVGISDLYAEGTVAVSSSLTGHKPVAIGFKDGSGNNQFAPGDTTNGIDVDVTRLPALVAGSALIGKVGIDQTTPGTTNRVDIGAALPSGTNAIGKLAANSGVDIGDVDVTSIAAGTNAIGNVGMTPRTSGGLLIKNCTSGDGSTALTNSAQAIKASAGQLFGWYIFNPNTVTAWVIIYNVAAASVTVGTTNPAMVIGIPAGSAANVVNPMGIEFTNAGFSAAAVMTSAAGNTAPTTALDVNFFYI